MRNEDSEKAIMHGVWTKGKQVQSFHAGEKDIKLNYHRSQKIFKGFS